MATLTATEQQYIETIARRGIAEGTPITARLVFRRDAPGFLAGGFGMTVDCSSGRRYAGGQLGDASPPVRQSM